MKIAYIAAGAAGMYCGSCLHDNRLARAMIELGAEVILAPTYTPIRTDEADVSHHRVFFGGVNAYLQQHVPLLRHTPRWFDRLLDSAWLLRLVGQGAGGVDPTRLGAMTVSMLRGEEGRQKKEVNKLVDWLVGDVRPDVVHLSNSMLLGVARRLRQRGGPPVVCALSGEDIFLEKLPEPHYSQARGLLRERAAEVTAFTALNAYYAEFMAGYLAIDRSRVHVVRHGLDLEGYGTAPRAGGGGAPPAIGYLARICHDKGLHLLVEACERLAGDHDFVLLAAGYLGRSDRGYLRDLAKRAGRGPLAGRFRYLGEVDRAEKLRLLHSLSIFSTPTLYRESKGLPAIEALAAGVPVVLPEHGAFPELVAETRGGVLHRPGDAAHLALRLAELLGDPPAAGKLGSRGRRHVHGHRTSRRMAEQTLTVYRGLQAAGP